MEKIQMEIRQNIIYIVGNANCLKTHKLNQLEYAFGKYIEILVQTFKKKHRSINWAW